jgi:hypothetical protein
MRAALYSAVVAPAAVCAGLWLVASLTPAALPSSIGPNAVVSTSWVLYIFAVPLFFWLVNSRKPALFLPLIGALATLPPAFALVTAFGALADQAEMVARAPLLWFIPSVGALAGLAVLISCRWSNNAV